jgi:hypothetical protein
LADIWVCGTCRSVNPMRSTRCYSCRSPRPAKGQELAATAIGRVQPTAAEVAAQTRADASSLHHTLTFAAVTVVLIVASCGMRWLSTAGTLGLVPKVLAGYEPSLAEVTQPAWLGLGWLACGLVGTVAWGLWTSQVVRNVPLLGGGWPQATRSSAVVEAVIPYLNLFRAPAVLRDLTARLAVDSRRANALILPWFVMLAIAMVLERPVGAVLTTFLAPSLSAAIAWAMLFSAAASAAFVTAGLFAIALVVLVERRQQILARERRAAGTA